MVKKDTAWIHKTLRDWIILQKLAPGEKIMQGNLAESLKVSRTPIVKALHKLESEGLVDNIPQRGFYVHKLTLKELFELFLLRESLEKIVVIDVTKNIEARKLKELELIFSSFRNAYEIDIAKYRLADQKFHNKLFEFCSISLVTRINETFQVINRTLLSGLIRPPEETLNEHLKIIEGIRNHDVIMAREAIEKHDRNTNTLIQKTVNDVERLGINPAKIFVGEVSFKG